MPCAPFGPRFHHLLRIDHIRITAHDLGEKQREASTRKATSKEDCQAGTISVTQEP